MEEKENNPRDNQEQRPGSHEASLNSAEYSVIGQPKETPAEKVELFESILLNSEKAPAEQKEEEFIMKNNDETVKQQPNIAAQPKHGVVGSSVLDRHHFDDSLKISELAITKEEKEPILKEEVYEYQEDQEPVIEEKKPAEEQAGKVADPKKVELVEENLEQEPEVENGGADKKEKKAEEEKKADEENGSDEKTQENVETKAQEPKPEMKDAKEISMMTNEMLLKKAASMKDSARANVEQKDYQGAIKIYEEALKVIHPNLFRGSEDKIMKDLITLTVILMNNLSLCYYNLGEAKRSLEYTDQALMIDQKNVKAHYRRALIYKSMLNDIERAFESIKAARKCALEEKKTYNEVDREYEVIKENYVQYREKNKEKEREMYGKMLSNPKKEKSEPESETSQNESTNQGSGSFKVHSLAWLFPSSLAAAAITNYVLKQNMRTSRGVGSLMFLTLNLGGMLGTRNKVLKALLALTSLVFTGLNYKMIKK